LSCATFFIYDCAALLAAQRSEPFGKIERDQLSCEKIARFVVLHQFVQNIVAFLALVFYLQGNFKLKDCAAFCAEFGSRGIWLLAAVAILCPEAVLFLFLTVFQPVELKNRRIDIAP